MGKEKPALFEFIFGMSFLLKSNGHINITDTENPAEDLTRETFATIAAMDLIMPRPLEPYRPLTSFLITTEREITTEAIRSFIATKGIKNVLWTCKHQGGKFVADSAFLSDSFRETFNATYAEYIKEWPDSLIKQPSLSTIRHLGIFRNIPPLSPGSPTHKRRKISRRETASTSPCTDPSEEKTPNLAPR